MSESRSTDFHRLHIYETGTVVKRIYPSPRQTSSGERRDVHNSC